MVIKSGQTGLKAGVIPLCCRAAFYVYDAINYAIHRKHGKKLNGMVDKVSLNGGIGSVSLTVAEFKKSRNHIPFIKINSASEFLRLLLHEQIRISTLFYETNINHILVIFRPWYQMHK